MGLFARLFGREAKTTDASNLTWARLLSDAEQVKSGVSVNINSALRTATCLACGRVIAEGVAQLPFKLYRERPDGRGSDPARDHSLYRILSRRPNPWMTSFEFRELLTLHAVFTGNAYAFKNRVGNGPVRELIPLLPHCMRVTQEWDGAPSYEYQQKDGTTLRFTADQIFHLRGPSWNGYLGLDAVQTAREAIGLAIATEETHARLHKNSAKPGGLFSVKGQLSKESYDRIKAQIEESKSGLANAHKTWVLDQDAAWTSMAMTGVDAQHIETRKHQIEEICRAFRVFPQMVMHSDKTSTFASAEAFFIAHVTHTLMPWIERWEQTCDRDLLAEKEIDLYAKMNVTALLRGTARDRAEYFKSALGAGGTRGWFTQNEVRALEEYNPMDGGDELPQPTNEPKPAGNGGNNSAPQPEDQ